MNKWLKIILAKKPGFANTNDVNIRKHKKITKLTFALFLVRVFENMF